MKCPCGGRMVEDRVYSAGTGAAACGVLLAILSAISTAWAAFNFGWVSLIGIAFVALGLLLAKSKDVLKCERCGTLCEKIKQS